MSARRGDAALIVLALALPALALVARLPSHPLILGVLNDFAHAPVFGALAVVMLLLLLRHTPVPAARARVLAWVSTVAIGGAVELIQPLLHRAAELRDLQTDGLGALAGLAIHAALASPDTSRRWLAVATAAVATILAAWPLVQASEAYIARQRNFPAIFEGLDVTYRYFISSRAVNVTAGDLPASVARAGDPPSLKIEIEGGAWPGIAHREPEPDWTGHSVLKLDLTNPGSAPIALTLRVHDRAHNNQASDRFNFSFELAPTTRATFAVPLSDIAAAPDGRRLDLSRVAGIILFTSGNPLDKGREFYVTRIWLE